MSMAQYVQHIVISISIRRTLLINATSSSMMCVLMMTLTSASIISLHIRSTSISLRMRIDTIPCRLRHRHRNNCRRDGDTGNNHFWNNINVHSTFHISLNTPVSSLCWINFLVVDERNSYLITDLHFIDTFDNTKCCTLPYATRHCLRKMNIFFSFSTPRHSASRCRPQCVIIRRIYFHEIIRSFVQMQLANAWRHSTSIKMFWCVFSMTTCSCKCNNNNQNRRSSSSQKAIIDWNAGALVLVHTL